MKQGLLVLTRRVGQSVFLRTPSGEEIEVVLLTTSGLGKDAARIGFRAPPGVAIWRDNRKVRSGDGDAD